MEWRSGGRAERIGVGRAAPMWREAQVLRRPRCNTQGCVERGCVERGRVNGWHTLTPGERHGARSLAAARVPGRRDYAGRVERIARLNRVASNIGIALLSVSQRAKRV